MGGGVVGAAEKCKIRECSFQGLRERQPEVSSPPIRVWSQFAKAGEDDDDEDMVGQRWEGQRRGGGGSSGRKRRGEVSRGGPEVPGYEFPARTICHAKLNDRLR